MSSATITRSQSAVQGNGGTTEHSLEIGEQYGAKAPLLEILALLLEKMAAGEVPPSARAHLAVKWSENPNGIGESPRYSDPDDVPF